MPFFQKGNVKKVLLRFETYLFWVNIVSLLKLLEVKTFLAAFHVPSISRKGCSQGFLAETLN